MDRNFLCFIEFDANKYDIIINEDISSVCFEDIYQKIRQIIRLALNEEVFFQTHIFEVFDNNSSKGLVVQSFNHFVKHLSTIRVHRNPVISPSVYVSCPLTPYFSPTLGFTLQSSSLSVPLNEAPKTVPPKPADDFVPHEYYCDICPNSGHKTDPRLSKYRFNLNFESYKRFSDLMSTIKEMSDSNCDIIDDYQWLNVIPYKMRAFGHKDFSPKLWKNSFEVFVKKYIEVMQVSPNRFVACSLFPFFHEFNSLCFDAKNCVDYKKITDLRQKMNSICNLKEMSKTERRAFRKAVSRLTDEEEDIKVFHLMVQLIDPKVSYRKRSRQRWRKISEILSRYGYSSRAYSTSNCQDLFCFWSGFYAQNYDKLNGNLEPDLQKIFDLLKIVHILDFTKMWGHSNSVHSLLRKISRKTDIKQYLSDLNNRKLELKPINKKKKTYSALPEKDQDLTEVAMDIEEKEEPNMPSVSGEQWLTAARPDPRLNRGINCVTAHKFVNTFTPIPTKTASNTSNNTNSLHQNGSCLKANVINLEDNQVSKDMAKDVKPIITGNKIGSDEQKKSQICVPRSDPRLRGKTTDTSIPIKPLVIPVTIERCIQSPNTQSESSSEIGPPFKTSIPSIFDPRIRHKSYETITNLRTEDNPSTGPLISDKVIKTESINSSKVNHSAQPSSCLRDPRLKRKLEQQSVEPVKQSSAESCPQNASKKIKLEVIEIV